MPKLAIEGASGAGHSSASRYIDSRFQLVTNQTIAELSTPFANAYNVNDAKTKSAQDKGVYALVFEKDFPVQKKIAERLIKQKFSSAVNVLDAGKIILPSTKAERYGVIIEKPQGKMLSKYLTQENVFTETQLTQLILPQLVEVLEYFHEQDIVHGNINPSTLYFDATTERIMLGECLSSFCGYGQDIAYESIERASCHPAGKGSRDLSTDYFALGACVVFMLTGVRPAIGTDDSQVLRNRFERGSYVAAMIKAQESGMGRISPRTELLIKALLTDYIPERWQINELRDWLKRKDVPTPTVNVHKRSSSGFQFDGREYVSTKYMAYDFGNKWNDAKKSIKIPELARWVKLSLKDDILVERIEALSVAGTEIILPDEKLAKIIQLLDPDGPIRFQNLVTNIFGLGTLTAYAQSEGNRELMQHVTHVFHEGLVDHWINAQNDPDNFSYGVLNWSATAVKNYLRNPNIGFGAERALYELNPTLSCQSPLMGEAYALDVQEILQILDRSANGKDSVDPMDRHLAAYICAKIGITEEIRIRSLQNFPTLANSMAIQMVGLLSVAQSQTRTNSLKNLSKWVEKRLQAPLEVFHSKYIKRDLRHRLDREVKDGDLNGIFKVISDPTYIKRDSFGYNEAKKQYSILAYKAYETQSHKTIDRQAYHLGLRFAVALAYFVCVASFMLLFFKVS